jgi:hypothetical protein
VVALVSYEMQHITLSHSVSTPLLFVLARAFHFMIQLPIHCITLFHVRTVLTLSDLFMLM